MTNVVRNGQNFQQLQFSVRILKLNIHDRKCGLFICFARRNKIDSKRKIFSRALFIKALSDLT